MSKVEAPEPPGPGRPAFERVLNDIGSSIVDGELGPGSIATVEGLVTRTGASRSVVREATRVLSNLGLLTAGRRVGLRILPREHWDVLDPLVIRWRLRGAEREAQLAELRALRRAIEPEAAAAGARRVALRPSDAPPRLAELGAAASALVTAAERDDHDAFLRADTELHGVVLRLSENPMFTRLHAVIDETLRERAEHGLDAGDAALHVLVADAIAKGDAEAAAAAMREIIDRTAAAPPPQGAPRRGIRQDAGT